MDLALMMGKQKLKLFCRREKGCKGIPNQEDINLPAGEDIHLPEKIFPTSLDNLYGISYAWYIHDSVLLFEMSLLLLVDRNALSIPENVIRIDCALYFHKSIVVIQKIFLTP